MEPLLSDMPKLDLEGIHWVIVGGETEGNGRYRLMKESWVVNIRDQVKKAGIPFLFKHWAGKSHNARAALLEGRKWEEYPESVLKDVDVAPQPELLAHKRCRRFLPFPREEDP